jgi:hypothetical protein
MKELKPVTFIQGRYHFSRQNTFQQMLLLRALTITQDPQKLREMMGVKKVADVYRTLDKMALRKEYHDALAREGISFDYIIQGIKKEADEGFKSSDRLKAFQILLKSLGMDKYEEKQLTGGSWEDELLRVMENPKKIEKAETPILYEVATPAIPESARLIKEHEQEEGKSLYE